MIMIANITAYLAAKAIGNSALGTFFGIAIVLGFLTSPVQDALEKGARSHSQQVQDWAASQKAMFNNKE